ncbi:MAG: AEC family transporter [Aurantimicrobium sp.]|nr:AEC family transporter [Aurantimicrobium sp.]
MGGVLVAFAIIGLAIAVGYLSAKFRLVSAEHGPILNKVAFYVFSPALLFSVLAQTSAEKLVSPVLGVVIAASFLTAVTFVVISRFFFRRGVAATTMGLVGSTYLNSNNIGLPVSVFVIGDISFFAPLLMIQLVLFLPIILIVMQLSTNKGDSVWKTLGSTLLNPLILATVAGLVVSLCGLALPDVVLRPLETLGAAAVPLLLFSYGVSLFGQALFHKHGDRAVSITAIVLKSIFMPAVAFVISFFVLDLDSHEVFAAVILASLPTAQNIFTYASVYKTEVYAVRDIVFVTTIVSLPIMFLLAALLAA